MSDTNGVHDLSAPRTADDIKALARQVGVRNVEDLLALDRKQDPFYAPHTPTGKVHAHWFAELWDRCGYTNLRDVHLRRMHYMRTIRLKARIVFPCMS